MKKVIRTVVLFIIILLIIPNIIFATTSINELTRMEYSEEFKEWLKLSEEEKSKVLQPRAFNIKNAKVEYKNPLHLIRMVGSSLASRYSLKDVIPENLSIRNQQQTNSCWAFATISSLETNLALSNYRNNISKIYDFSERHMEYSTTRIFANNKENTIGYNRNVGAGGQWELAETYLNNSIGAIEEKEMPFENNEDIIDISEIKNKNVVSEIYDTVYFEDYKIGTEIKEDIINQVKQHIKNYGSVYASIHGNSSDMSAFSCYNNETGAKYCNNTFLHSIDHAVSIIGWDDNYSIDNFADGAKPSSKGAWIVRNSWGERQEQDLASLKEYIYNENTSQCNANGWTEPSLIPNSFLENNGFKIDGDIAYIPIGDNGLIYVSYEDCNISNELYGLIKANDSITYDNIYKYNDYYALNGIIAYDSKVMLGNIYERKNSKPEYLSRVSLNVPETYTCRVYVNPTGSSMKKEDMILATLKSGESETFDSGYHTIELLKHIELTGDTFAVVVEITAADGSAQILLESKVEDYETLNYVTTETGKCFYAQGHDLNSVTWYDLGKISQVNSSLIDGDSTIKVFTTNELLDGSLKNIEITTPPEKTSYFEGENFDSTGMVITANYRSKTEPSVILDKSNYNITNGTNLKVGQTSVTITHEDKSVDQIISVEKNSVTELKIVTPPTKTEYKEGQNFDKAGMVIEAKYKNGTTKTITDYIIENGTNLNPNQNSITISFEGKTVEQLIIVKPNPLIEIKIEQAPSKTEYVEGQNFDKTGMVIMGIYEDGTTTEIINYTVENGTNLTKEQTNVIISYNGKSTTQDITVVEKAITTISINKKPTKLTYIQNKEELDLSDGSILVNYNDETYEIIQMTSEEVKVTGFSNEKLGKLIITLKYQSKTIELEVEIIEEVLEKAENSNLELIKCDIKEIKAYYFTTNLKNDYVLIKTEIKNLERNLNNDNLEYYYYLSTSKDEENITNWTKIKEEQSSNNKLSFTINTEDISNYEEISKENVLYLYIKELAIKGGNQSIAISKALLLEPNVEIETYVDNVKTGTIDSENNETEKDDTISNNKIPNAGIKLTIIIVSLILLGTGIIAYIKYKKLNKYIK